MAPGRKAAKWTASSWQADPNHIHIASVIRELSNLELWLELGVSVRTQLSLMELGMSRTGAIEVFELMVNHDMNKADTLAWLQATDPAVLIDLPELVKQGIDRVLARFAPVI